MTHTLENYTLYYSPYCPFCVRVTDAFKQMDVTVELRDTNDPEYRNELIAGGGKATVPCLKHPDGRWQYESLDIINYVKKKVS